MRFANPAVRRHASLLLAAIALPTIAAGTPHLGRSAVTVITGTITTRAGQPVAGALVTATIVSASSGSDGRYILRVARAADGGQDERVTLSVRRIGFERRDVPVVLRGDTVRVDVQLTPQVLALEQPIVTAAAVAGESRAVSRRARSIAPGTVASGVVVRMPEALDRRSLSRPVLADSSNTEAYERIQENEFRSPNVAPLSTFSVDVDRASYANVRRFLSQGSLPPRDAVRIEELVNYFPYDDPAPAVGEAPLRITTELAPAPWNPRHDLLRIALRARDVDMRRAPPSNLVFLIDVSGSMFGPGRLPLVKQSLALLVNELREEDRVAVVVYAGRAGLVLPPTSGTDKQRILAALDGLEAGGSTAGGAGIRLAYDVARQSYMREGNNRVILCTDGDFNVGQSSDAELVRLIEDRRRDGAYLTILGFGMGNYKDAKMEKLAGAGNGNYAYIDDLLEARKMLVQEMGGTLLTVAKDVKLQVEFDPSNVQAYRLLGYEDRLLRDEDFANDSKDAGDVGAGHTVTALYEIVRAGRTLDVTLPPVPPLRYQRVLPQQLHGDELLHVAMRYKAPDGERSALVTHPVRVRHTERAPSESMRFASAVAGFGMLLRGSTHAGSLAWSDVITLARGARGADREGYRADFIRLAETASDLSRHIAANDEHRPR
jgi:Ca-activated chloride channel family protein